MFLNDAFMIMNRNGRRRLHKQTSLLRRIAGTIPASNATWPNAYLTVSEESLALAVSPVSRPTRVEMSLVKTSSESMVGFGSNGYYTECWLDFLSVLDRESCITEE